MDLNKIIKWITKKHILTGWSLWSAGWFRAFRCAGQMSATHANTTSCFLLFVPWRDWPSKHPIFLLALLLLLSSSSFGMRSPEVRHFQSHSGHKFQHLNPANAWLVSIRWTPQTTKGFKTLSYAISIRTRELLVSYSLLRRTIFSTQGNVRQFYSAQTPQTAKGQGLNKYIGMLKMHMSVASTVSQLPSNQYPFGGSKNIVLLFYFNLVKIASPLQFINLFIIVKERKITSFISVVYCCY